MVTKTFEELKQMAIQIRDEKTNKQNTATRIGTQMLEHLNKLEQEYYNKDNIDEKNKQTDVKFSELEGKYVFLESKGVSGTSSVTEVGQFFYHDGQHQIWQVTKLSDGVVTGFNLIPFVRGAIYRFKDDNNFYSYDQAEKTFVKITDEDLKSLRIEVDNIKNENLTEIEKKFEEIQNNIETLENEIKEEVFFLSENPYKKDYTFNGKNSDYRSQYCGYKYNGFKCKGIIIQSTNIGDVIDIYRGKDGNYELLKSYTYTTSNDYEEVLFDDIIDLEDSYIAVKGAISWNVANPILESMPLVNTGAAIIVDYWFIYDNNSKIDALEETSKGLSEKTKELENDIKKIVAPSFKVLDINGNGDFTTVKDAVNNCAELETIYVKRGEYNVKGVVFKKGQVFIGENLEQCIFYTDDGNYSSAPGASNGYFERLTFESRHKEGNTSRRCYCLHLDFAERFENIPYNVRLYNCILKSWNHDCLGCGARKDFTLIVDNCKLYQYGNDGDIEDDGLFPNPSCIGWHNVANTEAGGEYDGAGYLKIKDSILYSKTISTLRFGSSIMQTPEIEWRSEYELINNTFYSEINELNCITKGSGYVGDAPVSAVPDEFRLSKMSHGNNVDFLNGVVEYA